MLPYIILFVLLSLGGFIEISKDKKYYFIARKEINFYNLYLFICVAYFVALGVFRETTVGWDSDNYFTYYWNYAYNLSWKDILLRFSGDNGFYFICKLIHQFTNDYWVFRAIIFCITFLLYFYVIKKETNNVCIGLLIFMGAAQFSLIYSILRQALAGALVFLAYRKLKNKRNISGLIIILLSITIHKTAVLGLALPFLLKRRKMFSAYELIIGSCVLYLLMIVVVPKLLLIYNPEYIKEIGYAGGIKLLISIILLLSIIRYNIVKLNIMDQDVYVLFNLICLTLFIQVIALQFGLLTRSRLYFNIYWIIIVDELLKIMKYNRRKMWYIFIDVICGFMFFYNLNIVEMYKFHVFLK